MILVDTSAWIEYDRATESAVDRRLTQAIEHRETLATVGFVELELLAGARDEKQARDVERLFAMCRFLPLDEAADYETAATLYRACRLGGETVRRVQDCLIAAVAIRTGAELLHCDAGFEVIARHAPLALAT